ncbi:FAD-dependent oxidoreductase [Anaerobaca lacustris]|uniref:FAD-dependent oxidoreductase n=1 Tax=Anaerobaca lacustris TaxID=3044600 RepID=A0AAW6U167_9BACT|nr:FAD-dependent oxidoreductase [Sedimentisphaerales bacterium M17dextr]
MSNRMNRRDCLRALGLSGLTAGLGLAATQPARAQGVGESSGFQSSVIDARKIQDARLAATIVDGKVIQPQRELPILHQTDVLVVGGGSAGVVAAIAAKRAGASVTLVERYGHFGGLWTGGLVVLILGHIVKGGKQVCQGIGEEMMRRMDKLDGAIINRRPGVNPTVDAEAAKYVMVEMIEEAGVDVFLHCWGVDAIVTQNTVRGVVFESKSGRQAILAKTVVDATGDGDLFAAAGAEFEHRSHNVGLVSRIGNLDQVDAEKAKEAPKPRRLGSATPAPGVNWVNLTGPEVDGLDLATLTRMEINHRKFIWKDVQRARQTPGYEKVYLVETAPQIGVRITRVLNGLNRVRLSDLKAATKFPDVVGVGGASNATHGEWQIPYGALVPTTVDNVLASGRCISMDMGMADLVRLIPNCFVTGHAAGVAAAVAVQDNCRPRDVDIAKVQKILRQQEAYLG